MAQKEESESGNTETNQISAVVNALAAEADNVDNLRYALHSVHPFRSAFIL